MVPSVKSSHGCGASLYRQIKRRPAQTMSHEGLSLSDWATHVFSLASKDKTRRTNAYFDL